MERRKNKSIEGVEEKNAKKRRRTGDGEVGGRDVGNVGQGQKEGWHKEVGNEW